MRTLRSRAASWSATGSPWCARLAWVVVVFAQLVVRHPVSVCAELGMVYLVEVVVESFAGFGNIFELFRGQQRLGSSLVTAFMPKVPVRKCNCGLEAILDLSTVPSITKPTSAHSPMKWSGLIGDLQTTRKVLILHPVQSAEFQDLLLFDIHIEAWILGNAA